MLCILFLREIRVQFKLIQMTDFTAGIYDPDRFTGAQFKSQLKEIQTRLDQDLASKPVWDQVEHQKPQKLLIHQPGLSVMESKELRRKAIMEEDLDDYGEDHGSHGDLTLEMLSGAMPKRAINPNEQSPQHPGDSYITGASSLPNSKQNIHNSSGQRINQNQIKAMASRGHGNQYGLEDDYNEQFKKNNAQLQDILMQLQTPQFEDLQEMKRMSQMQQHSTGQRLGQVNGANSQRDLRHNEKEANYEVSQFSYKDGALLSSQHQVDGFQEQRAQQDYSKFQMLSNAISQKAQFENQILSREGGNYRRTFQPQHVQEREQNQSQIGQRTQPAQLYSHNPTFQNAAQTMLDHKENYNQKNFQVDFAPRMDYGDLQASNQARSSSQLRQAQEFTLQPKQEHSDLGKKPVSENPLSNVYVETMKHFDDIPISKIQKMTGYQTHPIDYVNDKDITPQPLQQQQSEDNEAIDASHLPLGERVMHPNWRVRLEAYKEINQLFYTDYAKQENGEGNEPDAMASFEIYGPLLQEMIQDTNLVGSYEALVCLHSFVKYSTSIKAVSFATHNQLLEKLQTNKPNFKEISTKILLTMLRRDQASMLYPELIKRFKSKNSRTALFALHVVNEAFKSNTAIEEIQMKTVFRSVQDCFNHNTITIRELSYQILQHIYRHCGDEAAKIISFCRNLRPVQVKELTEQLQKLTKNPKYAKNILLDQQTEEEFKAKEEPKKEETKIEAELPAKEKSLSLHDTNEPVDLLTLVPENYQEIPYVTKINQKKEVMEQFNGELQKLTQRRGVTIKNKDYTLIFNNCVHMLEDKNMLVYLEAIRNIELLSQLLGPLIKQQKVKQFINLIANKYGEPKTAVVAAVDKGLLALVKYSFTPVLFAQECINQIAQTHKNPKVKQMVIEHALDQLLISMGRDQPSIHTITQMFKTTKEKMLVTIQKDTNASVRDACVALLSTFKAILPDDQSVQDAIMQLPKYRVNEILKKINAPSHPEEDPVDTIPTKQEPSEDLPVNEKPQFSKQLSQKLANLKEAKKTLPDTQPVRLSFAQSILKGTSLSQATESCVRPIFDSFGKMAENDFSTRPDFLEALWNESLLKLGEEGLPEARPLLIKAVHTLFMTQGLSFAEHPNHFKGLLAFTKRLFVLQRSIARQNDGKSEELTQYLRIALLQNQWLQQNQKETCLMLTVAMNATGNVFELNERLREVVEETAVLLSPVALQIIEAVYVWLGNNLNMFMARGLQIEDLEELRGFGIKYLEGSTFTEIQRQALISVMIRFKDLVAFQKVEIEKMRQVHKVNEISYSKISEQDESQTSFKKEQRSRQQTPAVNQQDQKQSNRLGDNTLSSVGPQTSTAAINAKQIQHSERLSQMPASTIHSEAKQNFLISGLEVDCQRQKNDQTSVAQEPEPNYEEEKEPETKATKVCHMIDTEFEKGLLMFKDLVLNDPDLSFESKGQIFDKLLSIVTEGHHTTEQQQKKQAYALKALMWMREEAIGLQECFELTHKVMEVFSASELEGHDSTVELYLLNFWTKELSFRDISDRISYCVLNLAIPQRTNYSNFTAKQAVEMDEKQIDLFNCLLQWFVKYRLFPDKKQDDAWEVSDLRKIVFPLCQAVLDNKSILHQVPKEFVRQAASHHGASKVREFMEVQLIQKPELFSRFAAWFDQSGAVTLDSKKLVPKVALEKVALDASVSDKLSAQSSQSQLKLPSQQTPRSMADSGLHSYKERRDQHKSKIAVVQEQTTKDPQHSKQYVEIISKIKKNLQNVKQISPQVSVREEPNAYSGNSNISLQPPNLETKAPKIDERQRSSEEDSSDEEQIEPLKKTNASAFYQQADRSKRYQAAIESPEQDEPDEDQDEEEIKDNLQMSELKSKHWMDKISMLEEEKRRIESQSEVLQREKDRQSDQWREKVARMESEHRKVVTNLTDMNDQYSKQLQENERLRSQLDAMQQQHAAMMNRFEEIEKRINAPNSPRQKLKVQQTPVRKPNETPARNELMVSIRKLDRIKETFCQPDELVNPSQEVVVIQKIQDLLLSVEKNVEGELAQPLICHYQKLKQVSERMAMITAVREALDENEDVLLALSVDVYKALLNFLLRAFSFEKQILEKLSVNQQGTDQNEITVESQRIVSKLLNSKEFTISLVCLFQLLREAMPDNLGLQLTVEQRQYLRVLMRCIQRITKALHSEQPDLIRAFDVLVEMQKMFVKHPPEQLREDLPCLTDFDYVYRGMKDVSDKMIELQPEKVQSFLSFSADQPQNAFIKYLWSVTQHY